MSEQKSLSIVAGAAILALGLLSSGWFIEQGFKTFRMEDRVVSVKGLAERDVEADLAVWTLSHAGTGNELAPLQTDIEKNEGLIRAYLQAAGFAAEEIQFQPLQVQDLLAQSYRPEGVEQGRYIITQLITLRTNDMAKIEKALATQGNLLRQGVAFTNTQQPVYIYTKLNDIKPEMLAEAVKSARQSADEFAAHSGQAIGGIKTAYQGMFQISARDPVNPDYDSSSDRYQRYKRVRVVSTVDYYLE